MVLTKWNRCILSFVMVVVKHRFLLFNCVLVVKLTYTTNTSHMWRKTVDKEWSQSISSACNLKKEDSVQSDYNWCVVSVTYFCAFFSIQLYKEIEICQKITQHIQIEKSDASSDIYGEFLLDLFFCFCQVYSSVSRFVLAICWHTWKACWTH